MLNWYVLNNQHLAAKQTVRRYVSEGRTLDERDNEGSTPLLLAARDGCPSLAALLLDSGANINRRRPKDGSSPLLEACELNRTAAARLLVTRGAQVNVMSSGLRTPLYWAVKHNNAEVAGLLLAAGARDHMSPRSTDEWIGGRRHVWEIVIRKDRVATARLLLEHGYSPDESFAVYIARHSKQLKRKEFWTPIQLAIRRNLTDLSLLLARADADLSSPNPDWQFPLMSAVLHRNTDVVHGLLELGADPNQSRPQRSLCPSHPSYSPFVNACEEGFMPVVEVMLRYQGAAYRARYIQDAANRLLSVCIAGNPRHTRTVDFLLQHPAVSVADLYRKYYGDGRQSLSAGAVAFAVLLRAGVRLGEADLSHVFSMLKEAEKSKALWLVEVVRQTNPMYLLHSSVTEAMDDRFNELEFLEVPRSPDRIKQGHQKLMKNRRDVRNLLADIRCRPPDLQTLATVALRNRLVEVHWPRSVTSVLASHHTLTKRVVRALSLESTFPGLYRGFRQVVAPRYSKGRREKWRAPVRAPTADFSYNSITVTQQSDSSQLDDDVAARWGLDLHTARVEQNEAYLGPLTLERTERLTWFILFHDLYEDIFFDIGDICLAKQSSTSVRGQQIISDNDLVESLASPQTESAEESNSITHDITTLNDVIDVGNQDLRMSLMKIEEIITRFLHVVLEELKRKCNLNFLLHPCGSVHVGTKVHQFDEIDFSLIWNVKVTKLEKIDQHIFKVAYKMPNIYLETQTLNELFYQEITEHLANVKHFLKQWGVHIGALMVHRKSPGIYMQFTWRCFRQHKHKISIDLTPVIFIENKRLRDVWKWNEVLADNSPFSHVIRTLQDSPVALVPHDHSIDQQQDDVTISTKWRLSLGVCDWKIFQLLDKWCPNVRRVYRVLKYIRDMVCPAEYTYKDNFRKDYHFVKTSQVVSSHVLENILLEEVQEFTSLNDWSTETGFVNRIINCLRNIAKNRHRSLLSGKYEQIVQCDGLDNAKSNSFLDMIRKNIEFVCQILQDKSEQNEYQGRIKRTNVVIVINVIKHSTQESYLPTEHCHPNDFLRRFHSIQRLLGMAVVNADKLYGFNVNSSMVIGESKFLRAVHEYMLTAYPPRRSEDQS